MRFGIRTLDELSVHGKTVLCRVDINQPVDHNTGTLKSINRIRACMPTIRELSEKGAKTVILAHQGSDIEYKNYYTTRPHADVISQLLDQRVLWIDDVCGPAAREAVRSLNDGEILLLDNVRFVAEEQTLFEMNIHLTHEQQAKTLLVKKLAPLADCYVCDAFAAAHRNQPSLCGFEQILPSAMGRLFEKEFCTISAVMEETEHPCIFVLGGAKIADAFQMMQTVLDRRIADWILTGGLVANIFLIALGYDIGRASHDYIIKSNYADYFAKAKTLYDTYGERILLPTDLAWIADEKRCEAIPGELPDEGCAIDIGHETAAVYSKYILHAKTVFINGPMGVFEQEQGEYGTRSVLLALADTDGFTVIGGGDSIAAAEQYHLTDRIGYVCTGGGAMIRFLSGEDLPVVQALRYGSLLPQT